MFVVYGFVIYSYYLMGATEWQVCAIISYPFVTICIIFSFMKLVNKRNIY